MPRYFMHVRNGFGLAVDEEGQELAHEAAARVEAVRGIRSILSDEIREGRLDLDGCVEVADETGAVLFVVPFRDAVDTQLER